MFFKILHFFLPHFTLLTFSVWIQLASPRLFVCPDSVNGRCCALNILKQTRHVWITCFKINPVVYRSLGRTLVGTGWHRRLVLCSRFHVVSRNRCLIREAQGGAHTSWGYQMQNHQPLNSDAGRCCGPRGNYAANSAQLILSWDVHVLECFMFW